MLRKLATIFILAPLAILLVLFAMANRQAVTLSFDPFDNAAPAFTVQLPLFVLIFGLLILGVLIGGLAAWLRQAKWRRSTRRLRDDMAGLHREIEGLNARLDLADAGKPSDAARIPYRPPAA